jgi:rubrerythrin
MSMITNSGRKGRLNMHLITAANLRNAHGGESMAHMRYQIWGDKAYQDGYRNIARLFGAIASKTYEIMEMYPTYLETVKYQMENGAQLSFHYALSAEKTHAALFQKAKQALDSAKKDIDLGPIQICKVCVWTIEGDIPDKCPICEASREKFQTFA